MSAAKKEAPRFHVIVHGPEAVLWEGEAASITAENTKGVFDILPGHANFISIVSEKPILIRGGGEDRTFQFASSILSVKNGAVSIYSNV